MELERIVVRALFAYAVLLVLVRASGKRTVQEGTAFDFVLALILGDMVDDVLWAEVAASRFAVAVTTLTMAHTFVSWLAFHSRAVARVVEGEPVLLIEGGAPQRQAMAGEHISDRDLDALLREAGMTSDRREDVKEARLEMSGALSVLKEASARPAQKADVS